tara:strand:+ start:1422 stop:1574 length:153 start_codon:yes stop_codon:yes gene_type:complete
MSVNIDAYSTPRVSTLVQDHEKNMLENRIELIEEALAELWALIKEGKYDH